MCFEETVHRTSPSWYSLTFKELLSMVSTPFARRGINATLHVVCVVKSECLDLSLHQRRRLWHHMTVPAPGLQNESHVSVRVENVFAES